MMIKQVHSQRPIICDTHWKKGLLYCLYVLSRSLASLERYHDNLFSDELSASRPELSVVDSKWSTELNQQTKRDQTYETNTIDVTKWQHNCYRSNIWLLYIGLYATWHRAPRANRTNSIVLTKAQHVGICLDLITMVYYSRTLFSRRTCVSCKT